MLAALLFSSWPSELVVKSLTNFLISFIENKTIGWLIRRLKNKNVLITPPKR